MAGLSSQQSLPPNPFDEHAEGSLNSAYNRCLKVELDHSKLPDDMYLVHARCLGYLIMELPLNGRKAVANQVNLCGNNDEELKKLSEYYIHRLIQPFKGNKECTTSLSSPTEEMRQRFCEALSNHPSPKNHTTAKKLALIRDSYRCVVTGFADLPSFDAMTPEQRQQYNLLGPNVSLSETKYCHIVSPSTNFWNLHGGDSEKETSWASSLWAIIESFGPVEPMDKLNFHDLTTGFTLVQDLCSTFYRLFLWFEYLPNHPQPNTYRVCTAVPGLLALKHLPSDPTFTFTSPDPSLPVPSPNYLQLHAVICRVARLSGAGRYLDQEKREIEITPVLADDGSSAHLLASRLQSLS